MNSVFAICASDSPSMAALWFGLSLNTVKRKKVVFICDRILGITIMQACKWTMVFQVKLLGGLIIQKFVM